MTDAEALAAVGRAVRDKIADGFEAMVDAAAAEEAAIQGRLHDRCRGIETAVEDMVEAIAAEAYGPVPDRVAQAHRNLLRHARAHERGSRLLEEAGIPPPIRYRDEEGRLRPLRDANEVAKAAPEAVRKWLPNERHGYWLNEAGLWRRTEHLFRLCETQRFLSMPAHAADCDLLAEVRKDASELAETLRRLQEAKGKRGELLRQRALGSVLYRLSKPEARCRGDLAAVRKMLDDGRRFVEAIAAAARPGVIGDATGDRPPQDASATILLGLVEAFEMYTGREATFSAVPRPSEFIRFYRTAHIQFGLAEPGGQGVVQAWQRLEEKPRPRRELSPEALRAGHRRAAAWFRWLGRRT